MDGLNIRRAEWSKSTYSSANGQCVEVARNLSGVVAVRDSKNPEGPKLLISPAEWQIFLGRLRDRQFLGL